VSDQPILDIRNFSVAYGFGDQAVPAVEEVTFSLERSRVLGVAGESGSGKSTLVYGLTRLLRAPGVITGGQAIMHLEDGEAFNFLAASEADLRRVRWSKVAIVMQSALNALNPLQKIGREFDEVLRRQSTLTSKSARRERAAELLGLVGLGADRLQRYPHELSGGQRQRVMIALALALEPELVIMDEPTTALDVVTQREIVSELYELRQQLGFAMVFITHDLSLLVELADEIMVMYAGRIVERAPAISLYRAPRHPYTLGLMESFPPLQGDRHKMTGIPGSPPDMKNAPTGCPFNPRCPQAHDRCRESAPPLTTIEGGSREVACWLHHDDNTQIVPVTLRRSADSSGAPA
jgi:peptide/nickel transport system ATP-binding protein